MARMNLSEKVHEKSLKEQLGKALEVLQQKVYEDLYKKKSLDKSLHNIPENVQMKSRENF